MYEVNFVRVVDSMEEKVEELRYEYNCYTSRDKSYCF